MAYERVSPGVYRDSKTGKTIKSATDPNKGKGSAKPSGSKPGSSQQPAAAQGPFTGTQLKTPGDVINTTFGVNQYGQQQGNRLTNANQFNPFGNQQVTFGPDGTPTVTQGLSDANQGILNGIQGNAGQAGSNLSGLLGASPFASLQNGAGTPPPENSYENSVFKQLTRGFDDQKKQGYQDKSQELADRGIPVGSDAYNRTMGQFEKDWGDRFDNARSTAVQQSTNTALNAIPTLSQTQGSGLFLPQFQGFQAVGYQQPDVGGIFGQLSQNRIAQDQIAAQKQIAAMNRRPSGGGGGRPQGPQQPQQPPSPFNSGPLPGS